MLSLLFVGGDSDMLNAVWHFFEKYGDIRVETSGFDDALGVLENDSFDFVISCVGTSEMECLSLLKCLRDKGNNVSFIIFAEKGRGSDVIKVFNGGACYHVEKEGCNEGRFTEILDYVRKTQISKISGEMPEYTPEKLSDIIRFLPDAAFAIDTSGLVTEWNPSIERMTGVKREDIIGKGNYAYSVPFTGESGPCLADYALKNTGPERHGKYPIVNDGFCLSSIVFVTALNDGKGAFLLLKAKPFYDKKGRIAGAIETVTDITRMKKIEYDLFEKEHLLKTLMDNLPGIVYRSFNNSDWTMKFISAGCRNLTGYTADEIINDRIISYGSMIHPNDRMRVWDNIQESVNKRQPFQLVYRIYSREGEEKWVWEQGRGVFEGDRLLGLEGLVLDISKGKLAHDTMNEINRKLSLLSSITRHDILNNLSQAMSSLSLIQDEIKSKRGKNLFENANHRLNRIRDQVVFTSRYQDLGTESSLWQNLYNVIEDVSGVARDAGVSVENNTAGWCIYADSMIRAVFYNLIENSMLHGKKVKNIILSVSESKKGLCICYRDDGVGIPADKKKLIFNSDYGDNTGFGLYLSRQILGITGISIEETGKNGVLFEILVPKNKYKKY